MMIGPFFRLLGIIFSLLFALSISAYATETTILDPMNDGGNTNRLALIIGNGAYTALPPLSNAVPDAKAVASAVQTLGYRVSLVENADRLGMNLAVSDFLSRVDAGSEVLLYYAGHGVELSGSNYLFPTDVPKLKASEERLLRSEAINLSDLLQDFEYRAARVTLVILDACRDNPFALNGTRSLGSTRGLARVDPPSGTFVIFAAGAGETALDTLGPNDTEKNGVFTRVLLKHIKKPGIELRSMVREMRQEVREIALSRARHSQTPSYYDQLLGDFYFNAEEGDKSQTPVCEALVRENAPKEEILFQDYTHILNTCELALFRSPDDMHLKSLVDIVKEQQAAQKALSDSNAILARAYISLFPNGTYIPDVKRHLAALDSNAGTVDTAVDIAGLSRSIQSELRRTGCYSGTVDGIWGGMSRKAVAEFLKHSKAAAREHEPSESLLATLRMEQDRVCPIVCGVQEELQGGVCKVKSCAAGQTLNSKGACIVVQAKSKDTPTRRSTKQIRKSSPSNCFVFNGERHCD
jgi:hypothetical protein